MPWPRGQAAVDGASGTAPAKAPEPEADVQEAGKRFIANSLRMRAIFCVGFLTVMTLAAVACFAEGPTTIRNVAHIRHKETDRIAALAAELRRLGAGVDEFDDGLTIHPRPLSGAVVKTYNDHRMAMSLALAGLRVPGVVIAEPGCVAKTYPHFFHDLDSIR